MDFLAKDYQERRVAAGVTTAGHLVEVLTSKDGSTWSILLTGTKGLACLIVSGQGWRDFPEVDAAEGEPL